ncbi:MAG: zinc ABC transporter substrate-binding protein [Clostridia bacterium]|nr:zinc ABC transporter substrate-binding protein [Clostridia bacterium]
MKRNFIILGICFVLVLGLIVAGNIFKGQKNNSSKEKIVTSFYPMYIATSNIVAGIDNIELINLTSNSVGCIHDYTLTPHDMMNLSQAKVFIINGSGMENFLQDVLNNYSELKIIDSSEGVHIIRGHHENNSHTFVSINNYIVQVKNIARELCELYPQYKEELRQNANNYLKELEGLKENIAKELLDISNKKVVALHDSFEYFAKDFGITVSTIIEEEEGAAVSATEIAEIIKLIKMEGIKVIVVEKDSSTNTAEAIAKETGTVICEFNASISGEYLSEQYINDMKFNVQNLVQALKGVNNNE